MLKDSKKKIFIMMSGGVDSSVAAYLLKKEGKYEVIGAFIKGYNVDGCQENEEQDARRVAAYLDIPFYTIDLEKEYKERVVDYMIDGYKKGITPNPDVMCNKEIKFGLFLKKAVELGADYVATGHYVRLQREIRNSNYVIEDSPLGSIRNKYVYYLKQGKDLNKDQSYFLWTLNQEQLARSIFPIGKYTKPEIREIAKKADLPTAHKKDSQGICFLGKISFRDFLKEFLPVKKGDIFNSDGQKVGEHEGVWFYTVGQRHLGIRDLRHETGDKGRDRKPYFVAKKDIKKNILVVAEDDENKNLYKKEIELVNAQFVDEKSLFGKSNEVEIYIRVRYRQSLSKAKVIKETKKVKVIFEQSQKFIAPGQSAVFYDKKGLVLGGGIIQ